MFTRRSPLKPASLRRRKRRRIFLRIFLVIILLGLFVWGLSFLSGISQLTIHEVTVKNNAATDASELKTLVLNHLTGKYWKLFARNNIILYPKNAITKDILGHDSIIEKVTLELKQLHTLELTIQERTPTALWCKSTMHTEGTEPTFDISPDCYFMDDAGFIFATAPTFSGNLYFRYYGLITIDDPIGQTYAIDPPLPHMAALMNQLKQQNNFKVTGLFARGNGEYELHLEHNGSIIFNNLQSLEKSYTNFITVLDERSAKALKNATSSRFEYVDLRFGDKVFYKPAD